MTDTGQVRCQISNEEIAAIDALSLRLGYPDTGKRASAVRLLVRYGLDHLEDAEAGREEYV